MVYIPPDPMNPIPDHAPPPYAPTDPSVATERSEEEFPSAEEEKQKLRSQDEYLRNQVSGSQVGESSARAHKIPQSNAIRSSTSVTLSGPLEILGPISSSGSVTLTSGVTVNGKISSSATVKLSENIQVQGKISASGSIILSDNVAVHGKLDASGKIELRHGIDIAEKVECSGSAILEHSVKILGDVKCSGSLTMTDGVAVGGDAKSSGKLIIGGTVTPKQKIVHLSAKVKASSCVVDGEAFVKEELKITGNLIINGRLHVEGDLDVRGKVTISPGGWLRVDGKRTIRGSVDGVISMSEK